MSRPHRTHDLQQNLGKSLWIFDDTFVCDMAVFDAEPPMPPAQGCARHEKRRRAKTTDDQACSDACRCPRMQEIDWLLVHRHPRIPNTIRSHLAAIAIIFAEPAVYVSFAGPQGQYDRRWGGMRHLINSLDKSTAAQHERFS